MSFEFSSRSLRNLEHVHPALQDVAKMALEKSRVDFGVIEGRRSLIRQRDMVDEGLSQTMDSRHLTGHAIDVAAWFADDYRWDFGLYYPIADAFREASVALDVPIRWGGCWCVLHQYKDSVGAVLSYMRHKFDRRETPFFDAGHFELPRDDFPGGGDEWSDWTRHV